jgi:hypothetical protein
MNKQFNIKILFDEKGRVNRWPKKKIEKMEILRYIQRKMEIGKKYSETEINNIIMEWHTFGDYALVRREMYDNYLINRTKDGREYWVENSDKNADSII